jgi:hypothetical protein
VSDPSRAPLLPRSLAFPVAGFVAFAAGQLSASAESTQQVFDQLGVKLPLVTEIVYGSPWLVTLGLLLAACGVLAGAYRRLPGSISPDLTRGLRLSSFVGAALALCLAAGVLTAYPLCFFQTQGALQQ